MTLHLAIRAALAAAPDNATAMRAAFAAARAARLDDPACATPAEARALMRRMALAGRADLAFGRLFEGHVNAVQLVLAHGDAAQRAALERALDAGAMLGVWNSDQPGAPLRVADGVFAGAKNFASGAGIVTHPLVTTDANDPQRTRMYLPDLAAAPPIAIDSRWWNPIGMARSDSHVADLTGLAAPDPIGPPGAYQRQPAFGAGALRFVAVQAGGVHALFDSAREHLLATGRADHPIQRHRLARLFGLADGGYAAIDRVAAAWSADPAVIVALVAAARGAIETTAAEALTLAQAAVGVQGLFEGHPLARIVTDLSVYLRQPNPDGARDLAGDAAASGLIVPGDADA